MLELASRSVSPFSLPSPWLVTSTLWGQPLPTTQTSVGIHSYTWWERKVFSTEPLTKGENHYHLSLWLYLCGQSDRSRLPWVTVAVFQLETLWALEMNLETFVPLTQIPVEIRNSVGDSHTQPWLCQTVIVRLEVRVPIHTIHTKSSPEGTVCRMCVRVGGSGWWRCERKCPFTQSPTVWSHSWALPQALLHSLP